MPIAESCFKPGVPQNRTTPEPYAPISSFRPSTPPDGPLLLNPRSRTFEKEAAEQDGREGRAVQNESRQELIERVKKGQREAWLVGSGPRDDLVQQYPQVESIPGRRRSALLPPLESEEDDQVHSSRLALEPPTSIERPRSALHSGDFRPQASEDTLGAVIPGTPRPQLRSNENSWLGTSPPAPWHARPGVARRSVEFHTGAESAARPISFDNRARSASHSALSFAFRPPTSPLAHSSSISDLDTADDLAARARTRSPDKSSRRRTFSPGALRGWQSSQHARHAGKGISMPRRENTFPYQAHQPRRSLHALSSSLSFDSSATPSARSRKPSLVSDISPLQRAPMIGRYEESILRGRMSSLPSRPLDFVAQIGVLGRGKCKASLRCPPHVQVPFPAVFFHSDEGRVKTAGEAPSPYVGMILLEDSKPVDDGKSADNEHMDIDDVEERTKKPRRNRRREEPLTKPPKGGYRIPQQGQLQIVIRNPNRTAVKLFLVPYDLTGMEAGQKTFIRQRSFSTGPIIDMPETAMSNSDDPRDRPVLRYVINLQICCPSKGRFFLYKSVRVVFANRVPDGKEKLRQEIQLPEPRFSAYRPDKETPSQPLLLQRPASIQAIPFHSLQNRPQMTMEQAVDTPFGTPLSTGDRRNFAWETYAQQDDFTFPQKSDAARNMTSPSKDLEMHDETSSTSDALSPISSHVRRGSRGSNSHLNMSVFGDSPTRHIFERLHRDTWSGDISKSSRTQSPGIGPGESLIAQQHRSLSVRSRSPVEDELTQAIFSDDPPTNTQE